MDKLECLKTVDIGQSAAKPRIEERSEIIPPKGSRGISPETARLSNCVYMVMPYNKVTPVYIGKTVCTLGKRYNEHFSDSKRTYTRHSNWFRKHYLLGQYPRMVPLECNCDTLKREMWWIRYFKKKGFKLFNHSIGGEGVGGYKHTSDSKLKISTALKNKRKSEEHVQKMRKAFSKMYYLYDLSGNFIEQGLACELTDKFGIINFHDAVDKYRTVKRKYQIRSEFKGEIIAPIIPYAKSAEWLRKKEIQDAKRKKI